MESDSRSLPCPANIFLRNWNCGRDSALDVTVISPLQSAVVYREVAEPGFALQYAWDRKMRAAYDACDAQRISFIPLPVETFGGWHPSAAKQIARLGRELSRSPPAVSQETASKHLFQRLALSVPKKKCGTNSEPTLPMIRTYFVPSKLPRCSHEY